MRVAAAPSNRLIFLVINNTKSPFDKVQSSSHQSFDRERPDSRRYLSRAGFHLEGVMPSVHPGYVEFNNYSGMSIRLSICLSIIEAHGGRVWAEPHLPHGAAFHFTIPLHQEDAL